MDNSVLISIIVPIYNVEKYLERCIHSLVSQTYKNVEILLINDGSPDNSWMICERYAQLYDNIYVYSKENGGLSDARNYGLKRANGGYVLFVDSDDYIDKDSVEKFIRCINDQKNQLDVIIGQCEVVIDTTIQKQKKKMIHSEVSSGKIFIKDKLVEGAFPVQVWTKLYRTDFLIKHNLFFEKGLLHEDELFTPMVFLKADKVVEIDNAFYKYVQREESIMTSKNQVKNVASIKHLVGILDRYFTDIEEDDLKQLLYDHAVTIYYQGLARITKTEANKNNLIDYKFLKSHSKTLKNKIRYVFIRVLYNQLYRIV